MTETAVAEPIELRCDRRSWAIPGHASIDTGVSTARFLAVAFRHQPFWPVAPSPAWLRGADALQVQVRKLRRYMESIAFMGASGFDEREIPDGLLDGPRLRVRRRDQFDGADRARQYDHASSGLRQAIFSAIDDVLPNRVAYPAQGGDKVVENRVLFDQGHILHGHDVWSDGFY